MRSAKILLMLALTLLLAGAPSTATVGAKASSIPPQVTAAAKAMKCVIVNQIMSSPGEKPAFTGETCKTAKHGYFTVRLYQNAQAATAYWLDGVLAGAPNAFIVKKGKLFVIPDDVNAPYAESAARYAAKKIDGKAMHGR